VVLLCDEVLVIMPMLLLLQVLLRHSVHWLRLMMMQWREHLRWHHLHWLVLVQWLLRLLLLLRLLSQSGLQIFNLLLQILNVPAFWAGLFPPDYDATVSDCFLNYAT
jgi:hypothetical protein